MKLAVNISHLVGPFFFPLVPSPSCNDNDNDNDSDNFVLIKIIIYLRISNQHHLQG